MSRNPDSYWLTRHVHACLSGGMLVFLDLHGNRYLALGEPQTGVVASALAGATRGSNALLPDRGSDAVPPDRASACALADALVVRGLLTRKAAAGRPVASFALPPPSVAVEESLDQRAHFGSRHLFAFITSAVAAWLALRLRPLESVFGAIEQRRHRAGVYEHPSTVTLQTLLSCYRYLRPLLFTSRGRCLFDALTLLNYLAKFGLFPHCVIGVRTQPFQAHCWVQCGATVLNDAPENVSAFTPILVA